MANSALPSLNTKNPTIRRILREAQELTKNPSTDFSAAPIESNIFEWHFTLRGPPSSSSSDTPSPYAHGLYHGRIVLPPSYPLRPPSFRFLTPSGRFEVNREICLSISGHHEETWQPAWGIRTALVAIRSFMAEGAGGQLGGMEMHDSARRKLADVSPVWRCQVCGKSNGEIMAEAEEAVKAMEGEGSAKKEEEVPEELRLAYREDLSGQKGSGGSGSPAPPTSPRAAATPSRPVAATVAPVRQPATERNAVPPWIDKAILGVLGALIFMVLRRLV